MPDAEFLKLLQMVEAGRACEGRECLDIQDENVIRASGLDSERANHVGCDVGPMGCVGCESIDAQRIALRERLRTQGVNFDIGVLEDQPRP